MTRALRADKGTALEHLRQAVELGWANYYVVINDPVWAETIQAPEFQGLLDEAKASVERQRAIVEAADAKHDFRAEIQEQTSEQTETQ